MLGYLKKEDEGKLRKFGVVLVSNIIYALA
jgi:hypothetical protein